MTKTAFFDVEYRKRYIHSYKGIRIAHAALNDVG